MSGGGGDEWFWVGGCGGCWLFSVLGSWVVWFMC